jgi:hypothetical protein
VIFSNRGEEQFVPHETMAVEHFADIFLHLVGLVSVLGMKAWLGRGDGGAIRGSTGRAHPFDR